MNIIHVGAIFDEKLHSLQRAMSSGWIIRQNRKHQWGLALITAYRPSDRSTLHHRSGGEGRGGSERESTGMGEYKFCCSICNIVIYLTAPVDVIATIDADLQCWDVALHFDATVMLW